MTCTSKQSCFYFVLWGLGAAQEVSGWQGLLFLGFRVQGLEVE